MPLSIPSPVADLSSSFLLGCRPRGVRTQGPRGAPVPQLAGILCTELGLRTLEFSLSISTADKASETACSRSAGGYNLTGPQSPPCLPLGA